MLPKRLTIMVLMMILAIPGTLNPQQGGAQKDTGSREELKADDFEPKPAQVKPQKLQQRPAKPAPAPQHSPGDVWREPVTGMEMVWVPGGCYKMGCGAWTSDCDSDESPVHEVCVNGFWVGKYEVTQGEWERVMGSNPSKFKKGDRYPVEKVSWNDAQEFIRKLKSMNGGKYKFRLPSEAEWEYACRSGGKSEKYSGGSTVHNVGWYYKNSDNSTHMVGTKSANGLGLYDMSGNVWEWVEDIYDGSAYNAHERKNPVVRSGGSLHVGRGGGWSNNLKIPRCANRESGPADLSSKLGFRLARTN
jgi:formylglycine-generating enzyme required for sulfatase activity